MNTQIVKRIYRPVSFNNNYNWYKLNCCYNDLACTVTVFLINA